LDVSTLIMLVGGGLAIAALVFPKLKPIYDKWNIIFPPKDAPVVGPVPPVAPVIDPARVTGTLIDGVVKIITNDADRFSMLVNWRDRLPEGNQKLIDAINVVIHEAFATSRSSATVAEATASSTPKEIS
jgi:hypothetical protein